MVKIVSREAREKYTNSLIGVNQLGNDDKQAEITVKT
jgi:hypothetical protein